jgi:histone H3/H4
MSPHVPAKKPSSDKSWKLGNKVSRFTREVNGKVGESAKGQFKSMTDFLTVDFRRREIKHYQTQEGHILSKMAIQKIAYEVTENVANSSLRFARSALIAIHLYAEEFCQELFSGAY